MSDNDKRGWTKRGMMAGGAAALGALAAGEAAAQPRRMRSHPPGPAGGGAPVYKDAHASLDARVADLLARMTLEEKIAQITTVWQQKPRIFDDAYNFDPAKFASVYPVGIGHMARPSDRQGRTDTSLAPSRTPRETVELVNAVQRYHLEHTRLGVPVTFHEEALHGHAARYGTSFPQAIALASAWDPSLHERIFTLVAREVRARGVQIVLAPVVDICRDARWGRIEETYGEDPYLAGELGVAAVKGFQGADLPLAPGRVFATLKHMTGHGQPEAGLNTAPALYSERYLREAFFPPFEQVVKHTNIRCVMASYNEIDGVPSHANHWLLTEVLRGEWGFKGAVLSDYFAIEELQRVHHIEPDYAGAAIRALRAGVDCDEPNGECFSTLLASVRAGRVREDEIDVAVRRMLEIKVLSGLFEQPYSDADYADVITGDDEARALSLEAAHKSVVLLKNDNALPLAADRLRTLAVIGPSAATPRIGGYSEIPRQRVSILDGVRAKLGARVNVVTAEGVRLTEGDPDGDWGRDANPLTDPAVNRRLIEEAVRVARRADQIVLCIGGSSAESREAWSQTHFGDRDSTALLGQQEDLFNALAALGKPIILVLVNGRPQSLSEAMIARANAIIESWYLGQEAGTALADILFGDVNPGGKLTVTIARNVGQLPFYYDHKPTSHMRQYLYSDSTPLFPFGFGLSYTTFDIGAPQLSQSQIGVADSVEVSVSVRNTGARTGDEVVQLYIHDLVSSVTRPVLELKGFQRVTLQPGETQTVRFTVTPEHLRFWTIDMQRVVEPGEFDILVGANSVDLKSAKLTVA